MKRLIWSEHVRWKLQLLSAHGLNVDLEVVEEIVKNPERVESGYKERFIAQGGPIPGVFCESFMRKQQRR